MLSSRLRRLALPLTFVLASVLGAGCSTTKTDEYAGRAAEQLYKEAKDDLDSGNYERAIKALERVEGQAAGTLLAQQSQIDLAWALWKTGEKARALSTIERFIKLNPSSPALDYAMYLRGLINFNDNLGIFGNVAGQDISERDQRASRDAFQAFRQLIDQFPDSKYAEDARVRMDYIINSLAAHELHVARYYLRRGAYVAAVNRARQALSEYQDSPSNEEALALMVQAYDRLQLTTLRDDTERVLRRNFPQSRFLAGAAAAPAEARPWWRFWQ
jgi:outer membrane protein assembly factor BamD